MTADLAAPVAASSIRNRDARWRRPHVWFLYHVARLARRRSHVHHPDDIKRTTDVDHYRNWRTRELQDQLTQHFDTDRIAGLNVVDFGCGTGELCMLLAEHRPTRITGVDISKRAIERARSSAVRQDLRHAANPDCVRFIQSQPGEPLAIESESVELICCFDALEHLADVPSVLDEWYRMLQPGGRVWIWWSPWRGPFGHHMESLIPLPWAHLVFSERTMFRACASLYDAPDFVPRLWDRDPETGEKKPNKWRHQQRFHPFLNRLTRRAFDGYVRKAGLTIARRETHGFGGSPLRRATRCLIPVPALGECFVSFFVYELTKSV